MADIKRPNYFTSQFLIDRDFNDEQSYHLVSRRRHNRVQHTSGVVEGLDVSFVAATQVQIAPGTAIDKDGREIVIADPVTYTLATAGNDLDVFLTISYQEVFDPADHYTQAGLDKFTRTTERPRIQDGTGAPPTDGSVLVLAKIHHNATTGAIESNASIDNSVRVFGGARISPLSVTTAQIADGAITIGKLAADAQPTAAQVDNHGGVNQLVAQINAGTGVITRAHLETSVVSGTITFQSVAVGMEVFSNEIDPGFGPGALSLQLALDDVAGANLTSSGDTSYGRAVLLRSEINRTTGRFKVFVTRANAAGASPSVDLTVRWYAIKAVPANNATVAVGITVDPPSATIVGSAPKTFTAAVTNTSNTGVTWMAQDGGTLSGANGNTVTYTPPVVSGPYTLVATSVADPTRKAIVPIAVNADVSVTVNPNNPTVFRGEQRALAVTVINTANTAVTWSILQAPAGGSLSSTTGLSVTYTAPTTPGIYTVKATAVDGGKVGFATINVPAVTFNVTPDDGSVLANHTTTIRATVGGSSNLNARWESLSSVASVSPGFGPTTTFHAPSLGGSFDVKCTCDADPSRVIIVTIDVPPVKSPFGEGGGKFAPIQENLSPFSAVASVPSQAPSDVPVDTRKAAPSATTSADAAPADAEAKRAFVTPKKRVTKPSKRADE